MAPSVVSVSSMSVNTPTMLARALIGQDVSGFMTFNEVDI
jgi:hypothetical protein